MIGELSSKELSRYLASPLYCPVCLVSYDGNEVEGPTRWGIFLTETTLKNVYATSKCRICNSTWVEEYTLTNINGIKVGVSPFELEVLKVKHKNDNSNSRKT